MERYSDHPLYSTWEGIRQRCYNRNHDAYPWYGGRGIKLCERWQKFPNFVEDMGERPEGMTLDRKDPNKDYEPSNCRWATFSEQSTNTRLRRDNKTGLKGVYWFERTHRWMVYINRQGKRHDLGYYDDFLEACSVRKSAEGAHDIELFVSAVKDRLNARPNTGNFKWRYSNAAAPTSGPS